MMMMMMYEDENENENDDGCDLLRQQECLRDLFHRKGDPTTAQCSRPDGQRDACVRVCVCVFEDMYTIIP